MLSFLLGTAEAEKSNEIYKRALFDAQNKESVFILVPEQYSMYAEKELISRLGLSAQSKIQILTFSRLSNMIFSKLGPLRTRYIDKAGKYLLAYRSLQICEKDLCFFRQNLTQSGFGGLIVSLISEFKRYGISPEDLSEKAKTIEDQTLKSKLSDLSLIYDKFNNLVDENWLNAEDNLLVALSKIKDADFLKGKLYINYFRSFTPLEYKVLKALMSKMDISIALCTDAPDSSLAVFSSQCLTYQNLCRISSGMGIPTEESLFLSDASESFSPEILHLTENYFLSKPKNFDGNPQNIHIVRPQNHFAEVQYAARLINRLCRTKGYSFNDFLILTGSLENYELIAPAIFENFGINVFLDQKLCLKESPLIRMVISILEILAFGFSYERIMTILRSGFWDIEKSEADIFENYILAADITHKQWKSREDWTFNPSPHLFDMDLINQIKSKTVGKILDLFDSFSGRKTIKMICSKLCEWLNSISLPEIVSSKIESYKNTKNSEGREQLLRVFNSFSSLINQISACLLDTPSTFTEFYELFCACSHELSIGLIPPTQDKVIISEVDRFRTTGAKVVIILGVIDKTFPKSHNHEGILSDADRLCLKESGLTLAPDSFSRQKEEQFLIYSAFGAATNELYISSPISDREGKSLGSSEVLKRIKSSIFPDIIFEEETETDLIEGKEHTFFELCARLFECGFDESHLPLIWQSVYRYFENNAEYSSKINLFQKMYKSDKDSFAISKSLAKKLYGEPLSLSVSKLEKYNSCAFSFFMKYGLLAEERLLGGLKSTDTGSILHDVLCSYFKDKSRTNCDFSKIKRDDCFNEISKLVNDFKDSSPNAMLSSSNYYSYMLMRLKSIASQTAWKLVRFYSQSKFRPSGFEVSFGPRGNLGAYNLETKNGPVSLKGFIDRVDTANINGQIYTTITDYKSSEKRLDPELIEKGITIQPLIYANAITKTGDKSKTAGMMYLQMNDPILKFENPPSDEEWESALNDGIKAHGLFLDNPDVLEALDPHLDDKNAVHYINCDKKSRLIDELFEKRLNDAEKCASNTAEKILDGQIEPSPPSIPGFDPCEYCPYGSVCRED